MEAAFAWLGEIINWFGRWIPRLTIINTTQGWVKFVRGKNVKTGGPGLVWHWPLITELMVFPVVRDSLDCKAQTITLPSGDTVLVEAVIIYEITDIEKLVAYTSEPRITIEDLTMGAVLYVIEGIESWEGLKQLSQRAPRARDSELNHRLKDEVQRAVVPYGVNVLSVMFQNKAKTKVFRLVND